jgi:hypothetical protein
MKNFSKDKNQNTLLFISASKFVLELPAVSRKPLKVRKF